MARLFAYDSFSRPTSHFSCQQEFRPSPSYYNSRAPAWAPATSYPRYESDYPPPAVTSASPVFKYSSSREYRPFSHHAPETNFPKDDQQRPYSSDYLRRYLDIVSNSGHSDLIPQQGRALSLDKSAEHNLVYELQRRLLVVKNQREIAEAHYRRDESQGKERSPELTTTASKSWQQDNGVDAHTQTSAAAAADRKPPTPRESCSRVQEATRPRASWTMVEPVTCGSGSHNDVNEDRQTQSLQGAIFCQPAVLNARVRSPKPTVVVPHPSYAKMVNRYRSRSQTQPRQTRDPLCPVNDTLRFSKVPAEAIPKRQRVKKRSRGSKDVSGSESGSKSGAKRSDKPAGARAAFTNMSPWDTRSDDGAGGVQKCSSATSKRHPKRRRSRARPVRSSKSSPPKWKATKLKKPSAKLGRRYSDVLWDTRWVTDSQVNDAGKSKHESGRSVTRSTSTPKFRINMDYVSVDTRVISGKGSESPRQRMKNIACSMALPGPPSAHGDVRFPLIQPPPSTKESTKGKITAKYSTLIEAVKIVEKRKGKKKTHNVKSRESLTATVTKNYNHEDEQVPTLVSEGPRPALPAPTRDESQASSATASDTDVRETADKGTDTYDPAQLLKRFKEYISTTRGKGRLRTSNIQVKAYPSSDVFTRAFNSLPKTEEQIGVVPEVLSEREINTDSSYANIRKSGGHARRHHRKKNPSPRSRRGASAETSRTKSKKTPKHKKDIIRDSPAAGRKRRS